MTQIVNNDELELKLTGYGLSRIAQALADPEISLALTKVKLGTGDNYEYYVPTEAQLENPDFDLLGKINDYEFYIYDKELLEDGLTVSFHTIIPEDVGGFDIREVGLYETVGGKDYLFAISTQQPFVKPLASDNYFININYYMFLKVQNFADLYDRITLDVEHAAVTEPDLEELLKSFLFAEENLMVQIGKNSELLGYNRPTQLLEKINENKRDYSYITLYKNFASVLDLVKSPDSIFSYWIFDHSRRESLGSAITDLSNNKYYLTTNKLANTYPHMHNGFQSMFSFGESDFYELPASIPVDLHDSETDKDSPFSMVFALEPHPSEYLYAWSYNNNTIYTRTTSLIASTKLYNADYSVYTGTDFKIETKVEGDTKNLKVTYNGNNTTRDISEDIISSNATRTLIAKSNRGNQQVQVLEVQELPSKSLQVKLFSDSSNYVTFTTPQGSVPQEPHSVVLTYDPDSLVMKVFINSKGYTISGVVTGIYTHMNTSAGGTFYEYTCTPSYTIYAAKDGTPGNPINYNSEQQTDNTTYCTADGTPTESGDWNARADGNLYYDNTLATVDLSTYTTIPLYAWVYQGPAGTEPEYIYTRDTAAEISQNTILYDNYFNPVQPSQDAFHINSENQVVYGDSLTQPDSTADITRYVYECSCTLSTQSIYTTATQFNGLSYPLYEKISGIYTLYTGDDWKIQSRFDETSQEYKYYLFYKDTQATTDGTEYLSDIPPLASYVIDSSGQKIENVDSYVGLIAIIKEKLSDVNARVLALNLCATMGRNPFLGKE